jgi:putative polyketide hydroxylase
MAVDGCLSISKSNYVPVLIVGGGLSGLASALFLAKHNIEYLLIETSSAVL